MPGKKRNSYGKYDPQKLQEAVENVKSGKMSLRKAAAHFGVPKTTVQNRAAGLTIDGKPAGRQPVIPVAIEKEMANKIKLSCDKGFGLTRRQVMIKAVRICNKYKIKTPFNPSTAGKTWFYGFMRRNKDLSLRKPQKLSTCRSRSMDKSVVDSYFNDLGEILKETGLIHAPEKIWNMDESGFQLEHTPSNVISRKGSRSVPSRVSMSREHVTVVACVNASGGCMPPLMIVKGKTERSLRAYNVAGGPEGALWTYQQKAWMEDILGERWFKDVFLKNCGPERPQLLILDGHHSHEVVELLEAARHESIIILAMPPHASHWLQPLDKGCFGPLTKRFNVVCTEFMSAHYLNVVTKSSFANLFANAWAQSMTVKNVKKGFEVTGIFPFNPQVIPKHAFATFLASPQGTAGVCTDESGEVSVGSAVNECLGGSSGVRGGVSEQASENERAREDVNEEERQIAHVGSNVNDRESERAQVGVRTEEVRQIVPVGDESEQASGSTRVGAGLNVDVGQIVRVGDEVNKETSQIARVVDEVSESESVITAGSTDTSDAVPVITDPDMVQALLSLISDDPVDIVTGCLDDIFSVGERVNAKAGVKTAKHEKKGHRILTSDHVMRMKQEERARKEKRETMKAGRGKRKNEMKVGTTKSKTNNV